MNKQQYMNAVMKDITRLYLKGVVDKASTMVHKPIKYNPALDENDYAEYVARKEGRLVHIDNRKGDKQEVQEVRKAKIHKLTK